MRGTVTKRLNKAGKISYLIRIDLGTVNGKRKRHVETCHTGKKDADVRLRDLIRQYEGGGLIEPSMMSVDDFFAKWLKESASHGRKLRTVDSYRWIFEKHLQITPKRKTGLGSFPISKVTILQIQEFLNELASKYSPQTVRTVYNVLKVGFKQAVAWRYIQFNPADPSGIELPKKNQASGVRALDVDGIAQLLQHLEGHKWATIYQLALASGARPGEYLGLTWDDFSTITGSIKIERSICWPKGGGFALQPPKTKKSRRTIPLPLEVVALLKEQRIKQVQQRLLSGPKWVEQGFVFTNQFGGPVNMQDLARAFKKVVHEARLDPKFRLYDLRHTCATLMLANGINPKVAAERLGHSTVNLTLDTYSSVLPTMQAEATERIGAAIFGGRRLKSV